MLPLKSAWDIHELQATSPSSRSHVLKQLLIHSYAFDMKGHEFEIKAFHSNQRGYLSSTLHADFVRRTVFHIGRAAPTSGQEEAETWICDLLLGPFLEAASRAQDGKARVLYTLVSQGLQTSREYTELDVTNVHKTCLSSLLSLPGKSPQQMQQPDVCRSPSHSILKYC